MTRDFIATAAYEKLATDTVSPTDILKQLNLRNQSTPLATKYSDQFYVLLFLQK